VPAYKDEERNTWYCKFNYKDWRDESKTKLKRGFKTKKEAQNWEREYLQVQQANLDMNLKSFVEVYFNDKRGRLKERTVMTKRAMIDAKVIPTFGKFRMNEVKPSDILRWQNEMIAMGYKETYLRMLQNQVTAIFNHAERYYGLKDNPCKKIEKMGRSNAKELNFWTKNEFEYFIQKFNRGEEMYKVIFEMLFWMGCRIGELLALYYEDMDFKTGTISITKTYFRIGKKDIITPPKTESSNRKVTIPKFLQEELKEYVSKIYEVAPKDRIFPVTDRAIQQKLKRKIEKLGIEGIRVHDLRHSHVALLIEKGVQPLVIAQRVGHESVNTTMNVYGHLYPNKQRQLADMLNAEATGEERKALGSSEIW